MRLYLYSGQYQRLSESMEQRWRAFPNKGQVSAERAQMAGFRGLPDQVVAEHHPSTLAHDSGGIFLPLSINGTPATYFFDTGAWPSVMSESEAIRLNLKIRDAAGVVGTMTSAKVGFRTAIAKELWIGNIRFQNVSFVVLPDSQEPWSRLPPGRRGLLGMPILRGLRTLRWRPKHPVEVGFGSQPFEIRRSNLHFDDDHLVLTARCQQHDIFGTLDTGAESTDLFGLFAEKFPDFVRTKGRKSSTEVRGVGQAQRYDSITMPEIKFYIGGVAAVLRPARVLLQHPGAARCVGNFGLDLLRQASAFKIDFGAMTLALEPKR